MTVRNLFRHPQWMILAAAAIAAAAGGFLRVSTAFSESSAAKPLAQPSAAAPVGGPFLKAVVPSLQILRGAAALSAPSHNAAVADLPADLPAGRLDPFAPVIQPRPVTKASPSSQSPAESLPQETIVTTLPPQPLPGPATVPPLLPPVPVGNWPPLAPLPAIPLAPDSVAPASPAFGTPLSPVDAISITGMVQLGDRAALIIKEFNGEASRHVFTGDTLANGQVLLKQIDTSAQEPRAILEYQGQEYPRIIGSGQITAL